MLSSDDERKGTAAVALSVSLSRCCPALWSVAAWCVGPTVVSRGRVWVARGRPGDAAGTLEALDLSKDQKPDDPEEERRILAMGGYVSKASWMTGPARAWLGQNYGPGLAMSRSLGDARDTPSDSAATSVVARGRVW